MTGSAPVPPVNAYQEPSLATAAVAVPPVPAVERGDPVKRWGAIAVALLLLAGAGLYAVSRIHPSGRVALAPGSSKGSRGGMKSLLVLPLTAVGGNANDLGPVLSPVLSEEIAEDLGSIAGLRVVAMDPATRARTEHESYADLGREFNVTTVLDGTAEAKGQTVTLTVRLIDTSSGSSFQERTYVGSLAASSALRQPVIANVAAALGAELQSPAAATHEPLAEAYRLYLQGRHYARLNTAGGYRQAHDYFLQAVHTDPQFAVAWAALATSSVLMIDFGNRPTAEAVQEAKPAAQRAAQLEPDLAEAQAALGLIDLYDDRLEDSADALRRATSLRPSYVQAHMWLGRLYFLQGDVGRAAAAYQSAYELEPSTPSSTSTSAWRSTWRAVTRPLRASSHRA
jgi:TolB-like protein